MDVEKQPEPVPLGVAKELGYTLTELLEKITMEELVLWSVYFDTLNDEEKIL